MDNLTENSTDMMQSLQTQIDNLSSQNTNNNQQKSSTTATYPEQIPQGQGSNLNSDKVDGIDANTLPFPNCLVPLGTNGKFPASTIPSPGSSAITDLTGDVTATGPGSAVATLANSGVTAGTYGNSTHAPQITIDAKGRITSATTNLMGSPAGVTGDIQFNSSGSFGADANIFWDNTHKRLGIGTNTPGATVEIDGVEAGVYSLYLTNNTAGLASIQTKNTAGANYITIDTTAGNAGMLLANSGTLKWQWGNDNATTYEAVSNSFFIYSYNTTHSVFSIRSDNDLVHCHYGFQVDGSSSFSTITSGTWNGSKIGLAYGGTNSDLSATGATSNVLKQVSAGAAITVGQLAFSDISGTVSNSQLSFGGAWSTWSPSFTGFSVDPGVASARYIQIGKTVIAALVIASAGTSNATTYTVTLPIASNAGTQGAGFGVGADNGTNLTTFTRLDTRGASTVCDVYKDAAATAWTNSGSKYTGFVITYEAN